MRAYTFTEHIARPPHEVWAALVDLDAAPRWRPLVKRMETEDGGPVRAGTRVRLTAEVVGKTRTAVSETVEFVPERRWTLRSSSQPELEGFFAFELTPESGGTTVSATCELKAHAILPWLFLPLICRSERRLRVEMLPNLKRYVEQRR